MGSKTSFRYTDLEELKAFLSVSALVDFTPGKVFYVDSNNGSNNNTGELPSAALATLQAAINKCIANKGYVIACLPGHAESITAAGGITFTASTHDGVTVVGMGKGASRPTFTFSTAVGADIEVDAASVTFINLLFLSGIDALTGPLDIDGADFTMKDCEFRDQSTNATVDCVVCSGVRPTFEGCRFNMYDNASAGGDSAIQLNASDGAIIRNCRFYGTLQEGGIEDATASDNILIEGCDIESTHADDTAITLQSTTNGTIRNNTLRIATDGQATWITASADCQLYNNLGCNADAETGGTIGTAST